MTLWCENKKVRSFMGDMALCNLTRPTGKIHLEHFLFSFCPFSGGNGQKRSDLKNK